MARTTETPKTRRLIKGDRELNFATDWTALGLLIFAAVIPVAAVVWWGRPPAFAELVTEMFVGVYVFAVIATFAIIILWGLGRLDLPVKFMYWLGGATVGEIVGLLYLLVRHIYQSK